MSESSYTNSFVVWHIARLLLTAAMISLPFVSGLYIASLFL